MEFPGAGVALLEPTLESQFMFESVAVVGATGAVGSIIRQLLETRRFPFQQIKFWPRGGRRADR